MKIKSIDFLNLGPFKGQNSLDLNTNNDKPIILIGGNNGSGKTTLLKLLKLGLHGQYAFGLKVKSNIYYEEVNNLINNHIKNHESAGIIIELELEEDYMKNTYIINRKWELKDNKINEILKVKLNGTRLDSNEIEEFSSKLLYRIPLSLLEASFFDGEEVKTFISNENILSNFLESNFNILFDIELFSYLENDLRKYIRNEYSQAKNSDIGKQIILYNDKLDNLQKEISLLKSNNSDVKKTIQDDKASIFSLSQELKSLGKLDEVSKNKLIEELNEKSKRKDQVHKDNKHFLENLYPFLLNKELIDYVIQYIQDEKQLKFSKYIEEIIDSNLSIPRDFKLNELKNYFSTCSNKELKFSNYNIEESLKTFKDKISNFDILNEHKKNKKLQVRISEIKDKLDKDEKTSNYVIKTDELKRLEEQVANLELLVIDNEKDLSILNEKYEKLQKEYDNYLHKNKMLVRNDNSIDMAEQIISLSQLFRQKQKDKIINQIESESLKMFNKIIRKDDFIKKIEIDQDTFKVRVLTINNKFKKLTFLSSGEQQILITCIVSAYFKLSNKKMQFVIDTPLARLDSINKLNYIRDLVPEISNQVIILSTDSEVDKDIYNKIKHKIFKEYTFENNGVNTRITKKYFQIGA